MDFTLTDRQREIREKVDTIAARNCSEIQERARDAEGNFPDGLYRDLAESGLLTLWRYPASGKGMLDGCVLSEAIGEVSATASSLIFVSGISAALIERGGSPIAEALLNGLETGRVKLS